ncbi:DUF2163 domain-containing protein [Poseidonocella sedimentorum]|uniref:Bacteriophage phiJL001 Gp84 C-terminal domain-containing protein n=1 Tax=Poseidonocella sedimentorum TaxID=871652 RepID=A0A1I6DGX9_9RHOB|nr:DUF2163 domain-containing protein [Poseidonocella sedimentorum]SFR04730.1 phage conserved hypothetical protein BR0599 [Poseidonocella sedimentorum]
MSALGDHLESGVTTLCTAWAITRRDGRVLGFTDHDTELSFDGITFRADSGLTARALAQSTGLSVDNTEALGALRDDAISEADIDAGRYDGAEVRAWRVNWVDPSMHALKFRGRIGEIRRGGGAFHAELRGLADQLNQSKGRIFHKPCSAILGDAACGVDADALGLALETEALTVSERRDFTVGNDAGFPVGWFERGRFKVLSGASEGLIGIIKRDRIQDGQRRIELWEPIAAEVLAGDRIRLDPGCDKRMETCRAKFDNIANFRGFPDIPGEDWMIAVPASTRNKNGGSRR